MIRTILCGTHENIVVMKLLKIVESKIIMRLSFYQNLFELKYFATFLFCDAAYLFFLSNLRYLSTQYNLSISIVFY